jgi:LTXXQ motif family protein
MKLTRICLISLGCVSTALAFGVVADAAIDLVLPASKQAVHAVVAKPVEAAQVAAPAPFELAAATSAPADITPVKVKTIPMVYREPAEVGGVGTAAAVPLPRPRPQTAPGIDISSISRQPASMAIAAAAKVTPDNGDPLGPAGIERMKTALALTAEQEEYWPAIAAELRALGKAMKASGKGQKVSVDSEAVQRLYWAAAPLISRLSHEQKMKVKQMAHLMGLNQVAEAL